MYLEKKNLLKILLITFLFNYAIIGGVSSHPVNYDSKIIEFSNNILLSTRDSDYSDHVEPTLAISQNDTIFSGWKNAYGHNTGGVRVSFSKSSDNGESWTEPFDMPMFGEVYTGQSDPWLVWGETGLYYAYLEYSIETNELSHITVAKSINYGSSWSKQVQATYGEDFADKETMTISDDGIIYVAYDDVGNYTTVRLSRSNDSGNSFNEIGVIANASTQPTDHLAPYVVTNSKNDVYIAWVWFPNNNSWGDVYLTASEDQGESFSTPIDINPTSENCSFEVTVDQRPSRVSLPVIKFDQNDRLYVLWAEKFEPNGTWDIYLRYTDNYGETWSSRFQVNPDIEGNQWQPDMDIDSQGRIHIAWYDEQNGFITPRYRVIEFTNAIEEEIIWGKTVSIADKSTSATFTRPGDYFTIRVDSKDIPHVVWTDGRSNSGLDVFYAHGLLQESSTTIGFSSIWIIIPIVILSVTIRIRQWKKEAL